MTTTEFTFALLALLITPGPTNTLMFLAGAERGAKAAARLIPAEVAGYLLAIVPLSLAGAALADSLPAARAAIALCAGLWVAILAWRLWRPAAAGSLPRHVSSRDVFVTTLLNPKSLIFGLVLLPAHGTTLHSFALLVVLIMLVAAAWAASGAWMSGPGRAGQDWQPAIRRAASVWLAVLSAVLVAKGLGA